MKQLDDFNEAQQAIWDYFGFKEDWTVFPIDDRRTMYWKIEDDEVVYYDSKEAAENQDESHCYSDSVFKHRHYPKAIYPGEEFTAIMVDTQTDGNKFLAIYDNSKKL